MEKFREDSELKGLEQCLVNVTVRMNGLEVLLK